MEGGDPAGGSCGWGGREDEVVACGGAETGAAGSTGGGGRDTCAAREHQFTKIKKK